MRRFEDPRGRTWDVIVGRESFGALYALFVPSGETRAETRQTLMAAESQNEAQETLSSMPDEELTKLFDRSELKSL